MDSNLKKCSRCTAMNKANATRCYACGNNLEENMQGGTIRKVDKTGSGTLSNPNPDLLCDVVDVITNATVRVTCETQRGTSQGTGFFITEKGKNYLVSNYHVIQGVVENGGAIAVRFSDNINPRKDNYLAFPIAADPINDVALLEVPFEIPESASPLQLAVMSTLRRGQQVVAVGNPRGMEFNCINGIIANENYKDSNIQMSRVLCSLNAAPGNSGGPVVRVSDRKVIGVATAIFHPEYMQSHTICVSADALRQMIYIHERKKQV